MTSADERLLLNLGYRVYVKLRREPDRLYQLHAVCARRLDAHRLRRALEQETTGSGRPLWTVRVQFGPSAHTRTPSRYTEAAAKP